MSIPSAPLKLLRSKSRTCHFIYRQNNASKTLRKTSEPLTNQLSFNELSSFARFQIFCTQTDLVVRLSTHKEPHLLQAHGLHASLILISRR